ncbi:MAG: response regulator, partial [Eubacteriales bacterium]
MLVYKQFSGIESLVKKMVDISIKKKIATSIVEMTGMDQEYHYILVVDDNEGLFALFFQALTDEGYNVELASSGAETLKKAAARVPSLVILSYLFNH